MRSLNLLSPERQKAIYGRIFFSIIERLMITVVILVLAATVVMLGIKIRLTQNLSEIRSRQVLSTEYVSVNDQIKDLNLSINVIERLQKEITPSSVFIADIVDRTPNGVFISFLSFDIPTRAMKLNGFASTRDQLLDYEAALLDSPYIEKLDSPISNLFQKEDLFFEFLAIIDVDRLKSELEPVSDL